MVTTAPLSVMYSHVGPSGDTDSTYPEGKFKMTLVKGTSEPVLAAMPDIESSQEKFFEWLNTTSTSIMEKAWDEKIPTFASQFKTYTAQAKKHAKKNKDINVDEYAKKLFVDGAKKITKEKLDEDGDVQLQFVMKRTLEVNTYEDGDFKRENPTGKRKNRPVFWKRTRDGGYENITESVPFLKKGTVVVAQAQFNLYNVSGSYGITTSMGPNIIVVWRDYKKGTSFTENSSQLNIPFIE